MQVTQGCVSHRERVRGPETGLQSRSGPGLFSAMDSAMVLDPPWGLTQGPGASWLTPQGQRTPGAAAPPLPQVASFPSQIQIFRGRHPETSGQGSGPDLRAPLDSSPPPPLGKWETLNCPKAVPGPGWVAPHSAASVAPGLLPTPSLPHPCPITRTPGGELSWTWLSLADSSVKSQDGGRTGWKREGWGC